MPGFEEARLDYRCAFQRFEDAQVLLQAGHTTGAVYLAGYSVECILKALVLSRLAPTARRAMLDSFRGAKAHDHDWLRSRYFASGGTQFTRSVIRAFVLVNEWSTELRYLPRTFRMRDARGFLDAAWEIMRWADGGL